MRARHRHLAPWICKRGRATIADEFGLERTTVRRDHPARPAGTLAFGGEMKKISLLFAIVATLLAFALPVAPAHAQASRTWVSGVGDDANPCSRTAPCKTFPGAI